MLICARKNAQTKTPKNISISLSSYMNAAIRTFKQDWLTQKWQKEMLWQMIFFEHSNQKPSCVWPALALYWTFCPPEPYLYPYLLINAGFHIRLVDLTMAKKILWQTIFQQTYFSFAVLANTVPPILYCIRGFLAMSWILYRWHLPAIIQTLFLGVFDIPSYLCVFWLPLVYCP